jgi:hypothetical protein
MSGRVRYVPDEVLAIAITAAIALAAMVIVINVSRIIEWVWRLPFVD